MRRCYFSQIRICIESALEFLCVDLAILVENVSIDFRNHIYFCMSCIALGDLQIAVVEFQLVSRTGMPLRYNNDKQKKPLFSRGLSVCRHLFNSFSKLKCDEKIIEKRRLFH